ncbi:hypothetical protein GGF50DRAFT_120536 [Schizophyllum commune]
MAMHVPCPSNFIAYARQCIALAESRENRRKEVDHWQEQVGVVLTFGAVPPSATLLVTLSVDGSRKLVAAASQDALVVGAHIPQRPSHMTEEEFETHEQCLQMQQKIKAGKNSSNNYSRHIAGYIRFWERREFDRAQQDATYTPTSAHPITVTKSCIFLKYECERPKVTRPACQVSF